MTTNKLKIVTLSGQNKPLSAIEQYGKAHAGLLACHWSGCKRFTSGYCHAMSLMMIELGRPDMQAEYSLLSDIAQVLSYEI